MALTRPGRKDLLVRLVRDTISDLTVLLVRLVRADIERIVTATTHHGLDSDGAYQYVAAEKHNLTLVSSDADFDRTDRGGKTPAELLEEPPVAHDRAPAKRRRPRRRRAP